MVFSRSITSVESLGTLPPVTEHKHESFLNVYGYVGQQRFKEILRLTGTLYL